MKKKVLLIAALFTVGLSFAQDELTSKKGVPILPEAGDWAIGFDASNLINFGGNLLNGDQNNSFNALGDINANTIYGKYFVDANTAIRGMVRIGFNSEKDVFLRPDARSADPLATVENDIKITELDVMFGGGMEFRRGKGRLQGVYGPMVTISFGSGADTSATYGNALDLFVPGTIRQTESNSGSVFGISIGGFAGVEYFFAPKMSLGGEIMWTIGYEREANTENSFEIYNGTFTSDINEEVGGSSSFRIDTQPMANISLNFHF